MNVNIVFILLLILLLVLLMSTVLRHALMILPFILTGWYLYWRSGGDESE